MNKKNANYIELNDFLEPANLISDDYEHLTIKVSLSFLHVYQHYAHYDWYLKADDDTFVIVSNLRRFLDEKNSNDPITYGYNFNKWLADAKTY